MNTSSFLSKLGHRCETCHGAGIVPGRCADNEILPCPTCKGIGVLPLQTSKKRVEERPCDNPNCKGGKIHQLRMVDGQEVSEEITCPICEGYGVIYKEIEEITHDSKLCPTCNGQGTMKAGELRKRKIEELCPTCHGVGVVIEKKPIKHFASRSIFSLFYPALSLVGTSFSFMMRSVKLAIVTKAPKDQEEK